MEWCLFFSQVFRRIGKDGRVWRRGIRSVHLGHAGTDGAAASRPVTRTVVAPAAAATDGPRGGVHVAKRITVLLVVLEELGSGDGRRGRGRVVAEAECDDEVGKDLGLLVVDHAVAVVEEDQVGKEAVEVRVEVQHHDLLEMPVVQVGYHMEQQPEDLLHQALE